MSKNVEVFGITMTSHNQMMFDKWIASKGIAMNTKTKQERTDIVKEFLATASLTQKY